MRNKFIRSFVLVFAISVFSINHPASESTSENPKNVIQITPPSPVFTTEERQTELAKRRKQVSDLMADNSMLILFSSEQRIYSNDVNYPYRQENNLYYLTALKQYGASLVIQKENGTVSEFVFIPKRNPQFEIWNGKMYSNEEATLLSGVKTIVDSADFPVFLNSVKTRSAFRSTDGSFKNGYSPEKLYLIKGNASEYRTETEFAAGLDGHTVIDASPIFTKLRSVKSPYEIKLMQHAVDITTEAFGRSMGMVGRADWEYEVQAEVEYTFRRRNADFWGYPSIVGCGANATTLHYTESQSKIKPGALLLMDVGAEYDHYTADVTRTFPVNGKFTKEQAEIYQIIYDAQENAAAQLKPGATISDASRAAASTIQKGLLKLGLITALDATYEAEFQGRIIKRPQYTLWYMHGWGHWIGMSVHDVGDYSAKLEEGMMMSNEPGIYIREDALDYMPDTPANKEFLAKVKPVFDRYKSIGVRIEDDMLITSGGVEWMSKALPRSIKDIEEFMKRASAEMKGNAVLGRIDVSRTALSSYVNTVNTTTDPKHTH
ncbi:MAG: aminopeptidase P family protein [Pyrinomonadaceae bacterium]